MTTKSVMRVYGCGGCGVNVVSELEHFRDVSEHGFAMIDCVYIDTSKSNISDKHPADAVFLIEDLDGVKLDGSGKKRSQNYSVISERSKEILLDFPPRDVNVVVHSASGGSGAILAGIIVSDLLAKGAAVVVITIGTHDSRVEIDNTIKTLKSYESIAEKRQRPVVMAYYENSAQDPRGAINKSAVSTIVLLAAIFSGDNRELDSSDLKNFLDYTQLNSFTPRLSYLNFFSGTVGLNKDELVMSAVTLTDDGVPSSMNIMVDSQAVGFVPAEVLPKIGIKLPVHAVVVRGTFNGIIKALDSKLKAGNDARSAVIEKSILGKDDVSGTDDGMIL